MQRSNYDYDYILSVIVAITLENGYGISTCLRKQTSTQNEVIFIT